MSECGRETQIPYEANQVQCVSESKVFHWGFPESGSTLGQTEQNRFLFGTTQEPHLPPAIIKVNSH